MSAMMKPTPKPPTIRPGTKRAAIYRALSGRVESTVAEIASAVWKDPAFTTQGGLLRKEISDHVRAMVKEGIAETDNGDPRRYWIAAGADGVNSVPPINEDCATIQDIAPVEACAIVERTLTVYEVTEDGTRHSTYQEAAEHLAMIEEEKEIGAFVSALAVPGANPANAEEIVKMYLRWKRAQAPAVTDCQHSD